MTWNYRVVDHGDYGVAVHEVYYDDAGIITHWAPAPRRIEADTVDDIAEDLELMLAELRKRPVLDAKDMPSEAE